MAVAVTTPEARAWVEAILKANGWTGEACRVRRIILDMAVSTVPVLYIEQYADSATFEVRAVPLGAEIVKVDKDDDSPTQG